MHLASSCPLDLVLTSMAALLAAVHAAMVCVLLLAAR
jgi:hypothetical protein